MNDMNVIAFRGFGDRKPAPATYTLVPVLHGPSVFEAIRIMKGGTWPFLSFTSAESAFVNHPSTPRTFFVKLLEDIVDYLGEPYGTTKRGFRFEFEHAVEILDTTGGMHDFSEGLLIYTRGLSYRPFAWTVTI